MLRQRMVTALLLVLTLLGVVLWLPPIATVVLLAGAVLVGAWEWSAFLLTGSVVARAAYVAMLAAVMAALWWLGDPLRVLWATSLVATAWWLGALGWVSVAPKRVGPWSAGCAGLLALAPAWLALARLRVGHVQGAEWLLFALALVWAADTGAFAVGRRFGRVRLAPQVSPGKTWEGVFGGLGLSMLTAVAGALWFSVPLLPFLVICVAAATASIVGDLTESMLKRHAGLKDSGSIFPGHGGMLDRIDSVSAAAPVFVLGLHALEVLQ